MTFSIDFEEIGRELLFVHILIGLVYTHLSIFTITYSSFLPQVLLQYFTQRLLKSARLFLRRVTIASLTVTLICSSSYRLAVVKAKMLHFFVQKTLRTPRRLPFQLSLLRVKVAYVLADILFSLFIPGVDDVGIHSICCFLVFIDGRLLS